MKKILSFMLSVALVICITAYSSCGGSDDDDASFSQSVTIPAESTTVLVTLDKLSEAVESFTVKDNWLTVTLTPYSTGAPIVKLNATNNPNTEERKTMVSVVTKSQVRLELTVIQKGKPEEAPEGDTIEDAHNTTTDQPAYAPRR